MNTRSYTVISVVTAFFFIHGCSGSPASTGGGSSDNQSSSSTSGGDSNESSSSSSATGTASSQSGASSTSSAASTNASSSSSGSPIDSGPPSACAFADGASPSGNFAFPQNKHYSGCTYPTSSSPTSVCTAYVDWYNGITTTTGAPAGRRVFDETSDSGNTTSEGMGYGMLIAVYMGDKPTFDAFWQYASNFITNGLMSWHISASGSVIDPHSATDADQDMAWALLMASKQWGGSPSWGSTTYLSSATSLITNIMNEEITGSLPTDGDYSAPVAHPDYAAPDYNAEFATAASLSSWNSVSAAEYTYFSQNQNSSTGLIPDATNSSIGSTTIFGFDACRAPWRAGVDYCWHGTASAATFLTPMVKTFVSLAGSDYTLSTTGTGNLDLPLSVSGAAPTDNTNGDAPSFTGAIAGPAAVAAMISSSNQTFINDSWTVLAKYVPEASTDGIYGKEGDYFGSTLALIGLLVLDGDFIDYTNPPQ